MYMRRKKALFVMVIALLVSIGCGGCNRFFEVLDKDIDYGHICDVMRKQDVWMYTGQSAAVHDGRIYYVSQEGEEDGIFSMDLEGGDVQFELAVPKITRLIVNDDSIYYIGADEIDEGDTLYGLYQYDRALDTLVEIAYTDNMGSAYDAFVTSDTTVCVMDHYGAGGSAPPRYFTYLCNDIEEYYSVELDKYEYFRRNEHIVYTTGKIFYGEFDNLISDDDCSVIDPATGTMVMDGTKSSGYDHRALYCEPNRLWVSKGITLSTYDPHSFVPMEGFLFEGEYSNENEKVGTSDKAITFFFMQDDMVYVTVIQDYSETMWLCYLDPKTGENGEMAAFDKEKVLIDVSDKGVLWAQDNKIVCSALNGGEIGSILFEIEMPENVVQDNLLEIAGDWLFVHKKAHVADTETNQLLYKVNLKTHEVIDV